MVVVFAKNLTLVAIGSGVATTVHSDPVPLGDFDRLSAILNVHSLVKTGGTSGTLTYTAQVSNDGGQNYLAVAAVEDSSVGTGTTRKTGAANGALLRFKFNLVLAGGTATDVLACCFDLHVNMDHV